MKKFLLPFVLILCATIISAQYNPNIERYKLPNGLTVILNYDQQENGVFGAVAVKVGSKQDPDDATGMAHYQEHMLFKGTTELGTIDYESEKVYIDSIFLMYDQLGRTKAEEERTKIQKTINRLSVRANDFAAPNEFSNLIKTIGGTELNAFTSPDMTVYHNTFPANQMEKWLELYSHRFVNPVFRGFQSELEVVYEEYNMGADAFITGLFQEFQKQLFKKHPYGSKTTIGTVEHLKNPSLTKMYEFFETYYVANNMILVLSGNFNVTQTKDLIAKKFSVLRTGEVPSFNPPKEEPFNGREYFETKMSPIKLGGLGFRTVPTGHPDELKLRVINNLLNNSTQSGLLDELANNNELLAAQIIPFPFQDEGSSLLLFIPKIIGQKLEEAEKLVLQKIKKLHNGDFEDWMLESAKNNLYIEEQRKLESKTEIALDLINTEMLGIELNSIFNNTELIRNFSKEEIIETAKKYYGSNYLAFYSLQTLKQSKEKVEKPEFEPVIPNGEEESEYAANFNKVKTSATNIKYIDFNTAIYKNQLNGDNTFYHTSNPKNDIFSLTIEYEVGTDELPMLNYTAMVLDNAGTKNIDSKTLKDTFSFYNCSFSFRASKNKTTITFNGLEQNINELMPLINELISQPTLDEKNIKTIVQNEKSTRKLEKTEADELASALFEYMRHGDKSAYIDRLSMKEIKKLEPSKLIEAYEQVIQYRANIHYVGQRLPAEIELLLLEHIPMSEVAKAGEIELKKQTKQYDKNTIYFVDKKNARQSKVFIMLNEFDYQPDMRAKIDAFNLYFGGDFSGLVLQEIREYRSLAYTAGAWVTMPTELTEPCGFIGFVGTQADKTNEAIDVYYNLLKDMPDKDERIGLVKNYLINKAQNQQPSFRYMSKTISAWQDMGYLQDPRLELMPQYEAMTYDDIKLFYNDFIKQNTVSIAISGDSREIDLKELEKYGNVIVVKQKNIISK